MVFQGKKAIVTGSGRGIGAAIATMFAENGADVIVHYVHNQQSAEETANQVRQAGRTCQIVRANIGKTEGIQKLFDAVEEEFGRLDFFVANAASGFNRPGLEQKISGWDYTMNVNARSFLFMTQLATPLMEKTGGGRIIAITSPGAERVLPDYIISVGASKAALNALVRYLAVELADKNIRVNGIAPGIVDTDALKHFSFMRGNDVLQRTAAKTPAGRLVTPKDVAELTKFLCTPAAEMICGQIITIDGGFTLLLPQ